MSDQKNVLTGKKLPDGTYDIGNGLRARVVEKRAPMTDEERAAAKAAQEAKEAAEQQQNQEKREKSLDTYINVLNLEAKKNTLMNKVSEYRKGGEDLLSHIGESFNRDIISEKLATVSTMEELAKRISTDEGVLWFFTDDETKEVLQMNVKDIDKKREMEFRKGLLMYLKQTDIYQAEIDKACEEMDAAQKEFDAGVAESTAILADGILDAAKMFRQVAAESKGNYAKLMRRAEHIESAYTFAVVKEVAKDHPSVIEKTIKEMQKEGSIVALGDRYRGKLKSAKVQSNLFAFIGEDNGNRSVEYTIFPKEDIVPGTENLFIFALIRFFAMESWTLDKAIKAFHSAVCITLSKLMSDTMPENDRKMMIDNIREMMQPYWDKYKELNDIQ